VCRPQTDAYGYLNWYLITITLSWPSISQLSIHVCALRLITHLPGVRPEDKAAKKQRLLSEAEARESGSEPADKKKPIVVKYGINHITSLVSFSFQDSTMAAVVGMLFNICRAETASYGLQRLSGLPATPLLSQVFTTSQVRGVLSLSRGADREWHSTVGCNRARR
jgi:hypothetical protein